MNATNETEHAAVAENAVSDGQQSVDYQKPESSWKQMRTSEDWFAIWCGGFILTVTFAAIWFAKPADWSQQVADAKESGQSAKIDSLLKPYLAKPGKWGQKPKDVQQEAFQVQSNNPIAAFYQPASGDAPASTPIVGVLGAGVLIWVLFTVAMWLRKKDAGGFAKGFPVVFLLATLAYVLAGHAAVKAFNLEYALWALAIGLVISNTVGTPNWLRSAAQSEFFIKTGLVVMGAGVLMSKLVALGPPGIAVAWVVTPIVLVSTYVFGQKVLKMKSRSLNMVISADMSVCGVSAAIATAAACKAKKEELSSAIGLSLGFTVIMMVIMPFAINSMNLPPKVAGAWIGGTIDATGAVAVAGDMLALEPVADAAQSGAAQSSAVPPTGDSGAVAKAATDEAVQVAVTIKMIQNILIGLTAFFVALYWVRYVDRSASADQKSIGLSEIWYRFPKFVFGFVVASVIFSLLYSNLTGGDVMISSMIKQSSKVLRGWLFCLAFVSIGLEINFKQLLPHFRDGKPVMLYICGQSLNILLTFLMAWAVFGG